MSGMLKNSCPSLSRREFLTNAVGAGGAMLLGPAWLHAAGDGVDPRVAQVMSRTISIDMHNHVYPAGTEPHRQQGQEQQQQAPFSWQKKSNSQALPPSVRASCWI